MIKITKEEAIYIRKRLPNVHIRRTVHKYYMEENSKALRMIELIREDRTDDKYKPRAHGNKHSRDKRAYNKALKK